MKSHIKKTIAKNRGLIAVSGVFMLTAATFNILWLAMAFTRAVDVKELLRLTWVISPFPYIILAIGFGGNTLLSSVLAIIFVLGILLSSIGGILALRKRAWGLTFIGSIGAFICVPLLGITAITITIMSKRQFTGHQKS